MSSAGSVSSCELEFSGLTLDLSDLDSVNAVKDKLLSDDSHHVHGTNLKGLKGISETNRILSPNDMRQLGIIPQSGESYDGIGWAQQAAPNQPIAQGVSLFPFDRYGESQAYTKGDVKIIIGIKSTTLMANAHVQLNLGHGLSHGSIFNDNISKIYIPQGTRAQVVNTIQGGENSSILIDKLEEYNAVFE